MPRSPVRDRPLKAAVADAARFTRKSARDRARELGFQRGRHGVDFAAFLALYAEQDGKCAICEIPFGAYHVDHNHATGALLCPSCNLGLGFFKDRPALLIKAAQYVASHGNDLPQIIKLPALPAWADLEEAMVEEQRAYVALMRRLDEMRSA